MYAIVEIAGKQYRVEKDMYIYTDLLNVDKGESVSFDKVLLVDNEEGKIQLGNPTVSGVKVNAKVLDHVKGDTVIVFKKKRRKTYEKRNGHRQQYSKVLVESIG
ncbi:MAG: 50S ribosomal protein L21 [Cytophagales bacterium]